MAIDSRIPEIALLKEAVVKAFGKTPYVHSDFVELRDNIFSVTREYVSETTLERIWEYSTRGYDSVSRRVLDVLSAYIDSGNWEGFLERLKENVGGESDYFDIDIIRSEDLQSGAGIRIGWPPDRVCTIRYLGNNRFMAIETRNAKLQPGDTFSCLQFQLHHPQYLTDLKDADGNLKGRSYGVGLHHGLTTLQLLTPENS